MITIGILGIQGAIEEHVAMVHKSASELSLDLTTVKLVDPRDLVNIDGIILPGGESTAMMLMGKRNGMLEEVRCVLENGIPAFGTCAGAILLSKHVQRNAGEKEHQGAFPFMDTYILRNGYGRQRESFSTNLQINEMKSSFPGIFIRAPLIDKIEKDAIILSSFNGKPVLIRQRNFLASTFHPELSVDTRIHNYFLRMVIQS